MLLKKPTTAFCSSGSLSTLTSTPITSPCRAHRESPVERPALRASAPRTFMTSRSATNIRSPTKLRSYATIASDSSDASNKPSSSEPKWPCTTNPTPYDIFCQTRSDPYNRARYYELVKLYHPDRHHLYASCGVSARVRLERYRLVLAANDILSDPTRRRQYDLHGAGWGSSSPLSAADVRHADRSWRSEPGNASMNATWEDWERWYQQRDGAHSEKQEPVFMSNGGFAGLVVAFIVVAIWGQLTWAGQRGQKLVEGVEERSENISQELWRRQAEQARLTREGRVENFLKQRESWGPR